MIWNDRIRELRKQNNYTLLEIANKLGISEATAQRYEKSNGIKNIPYDSIIDLSKLFNVSPSYIMGWEDTAYKKSVRIPVLGRIAAGPPIYAEENIIDYEDIPDEMDRTGEYFGLIVEGDSMEPDIHNRDIVIVRRQESADTGDVVVAMVNSDDAVCKRLMRYEWGIQLISNNPAYDPIVFTNEQVESLPVKILGKVIELRRKF